MQFKPVPKPPSSIDRLEEILAAVPRTPQYEEDCCSLLVAEADVPTIDAAWTWLSVLRAFELVAKTPDGFVRRDRINDSDPRESSDGQITEGVDTEAGRSTVDKERLALSLRERVFDADRILDALDSSEARTVSDVTDTLLDLDRRDRTGSQSSTERSSPGRSTPEPSPSERSIPDRERVRRILEWSVLLGVTERTENGYRLTDVPDNR